jgi:hypothetical protein
MAFYSLICFRRESRFGRCCRFLSRGGLFLAGGLDIVDPQNR